MTQDVLRFMTCGSVDDGKSTLIGRMLYDSGMVFDDQMVELKSNSKKYGTTNKELDFALLVDGLSAEQEQGITIDIAYRFFHTSKRKFIVADTPGHVQYTRNMATAASTADLALILVDASQGLTSQTKRHSYIASTFGVRHVVVAVNKMDLVSYSEDDFKKISQNYLMFAKDLGFSSVKVVPISALEGSNICASSPQMPWYEGKSLFEYLEQVDIAEKKEKELSFRMPVQRVVRPNQKFRGFSGTVASGDISVGERITVLPSGKSSKVQSVIANMSEKKTATSKQAVTITLEDEIDISRGDILSCSQNLCPVSDVFRTQILWMSDVPMVSGREYIFKSVVSEQNCTIKQIKYTVDVENMQHIAADTLKLNDIGVCDLYLNKKTAYDRFENHSDLGAFILIDRHTNQTIAMGMIEYAMSRSFNITEQHLTISRKQRALQKSQKPCTFWMTGLSGSGKSTIANALEQALFEKGFHTIILDGDNVRHGLNKDLGFTEHQRAENIRRIAEVSKLMMDAGLIVIVSFISPFEAEREMAKRIIGEEDFVEVYIDAPLEVAEKRDVKGLYKKARAGKIPNFTGISSPYEPPRTPDLRLRTEKATVEENAQEIISYIKEKGLLREGD